MKYFDFSCPFCQQQFSIASELEGEFFKCPTCGQDFVIESTETRSASAKRTEIEQNINSHPETVSVQIEQLKLEIARQAEFANTAVRELKNINRLLSWLFGLLIVIILFIHFITVPAFLQNIGDHLNKLADNIPGQITDNRIISYTWEEFGEMESKVRNALDAGYEPAGFMCNNSLKGGLFLFVKRKKD